MKFVADENLDRSVIQELREAGHEVISVAEMEPGIPDEVVLATASSHAAMLITVPAELALPDADRPRGR